MRTGQISRAIFVVTLAVVSLSACASRGGGVLASTPTPTSPVICSQIGGTELVDGCPPPSDSSPHYKENLKYRDRQDLSAQETDAATGFIQPVTTALQPLADGQVPMTKDSVVAAVVSAGFASRDVQTVEGVGIGFGASTGYGCVFGSVGAGTVSVEVGGYINDGGCLAVSGH
ncbi:MAG: hypothetical protein QOI70_1347 [Microbacteriaceae bacterium]|jgi:hypothetical protein|nr:hypothetical protein [Microbacteriaceae bacterium]